MGRHVEYKDRVRDAFLSSTKCLKEISNEFGVPYETLRGWAKQEGWHQKRILRQIGDELADDIIEQANIIRSVLFHRIISEDHDPDELAELVKSWRSLLGVRKTEEPEETFDRDVLLAKLK